MVGKTESDPSDGAPSVGGSLRGGMRFPASHRGLCDVGPCLLACGTKGPVRETLDMYLPSSVGHDAACQIGENEKSGADER